MNASRSLGSLLVLAAGLPACASSVPWPPRDGSCIEAHRSGSGPGATWRYAIQGREAPRADVERLVDRSPATHARFRRHRAVNVAAATLVGGGAGATFGGYVAAGAANRPSLSWISVAGLAVSALGIALAVTNQDPFRWAVDRYNEEARRQGTCGPAPGPPGEGARP